MRIGSLVYHGRIDNLFEDFGRARPAATTHELEDAIRRGDGWQRGCERGGARRWLLYFGSEMKWWPQSAAIGVAILAVFCVARRRMIRQCRRLVLRAVIRKQRVPTYTHDIAPILFRSCAPCHRPGEAAPFSLLTLCGREISRAIDRGSDEAAHHAAVAACGGRSKICG